MALTDVIRELQENVAAIQGIRRAPTEPPESMSVYPFAVAYGASGTVSSLNHKTPLQHKEHTLIVQIHIQRRDLPRSVAEAAPYLERFSNAIRDDPTLGGTVAPIKTFDWNFDGLPQYGGVDTIGYEFTLNVVEVNN